MSTSHALRPMYLQGSGSPFFAILNRASAPAATAVLLCPPFGWQDMSTYRIRHEWARQLARAGYTSLRLDLPGSGDSAGTPSDPRRLEAWTQAVDDAVQWLRGIEGAQQIAVIGIGLGGMLACRAALGGTPIEELVLWSVPVRGHTLVRELRAFSALEAANDVDRAQPLQGDERGDGALSVNGYLLSAETVAALEGLDLQEVELGSPALRRALLLRADGLKIDQTLPGIIARSGAEVTVADGPGYGAMMAEIPGAQAPTEVFTLVSSWLGEGAPRQGPSVAPAPARRRLVGSASGGEVSDRDEVVLHCAGVALRERPMFFEAQAGRLFGVLSEPLEDRHELTAVLLNAGPEPRTGRARMWVELARRWAARGVATLRLDAAGIGDFDGEVIAPRYARDFYNPMYAEQACAALEMLAQRGLPQRFVMVGFCSGGHCSAQAALHDDRVAAVLMINPLTLVFNDHDWQWRYTLRQMRQLRERILLASTWRKVLRGEIRLEQHLQTGRAFVEGAVTAPMSQRGRILARDRQNGHGRRPAQHKAVEELFDALGDRDQRALLLFTGQESLHAELSRHGVLDHLERWPNLELAHLGPDCDAFTVNSLSVQRQVHSVLDRRLEEELTRLPAGHLSP